MKSNRTAVAMFALLLTLSGALQAADTPPQAKYPDYPSETPATFVPATGSFDYVSRDVMIPMRDGVKLHTVILVPKGAQHAGMLLTRTPYDAKALTTHTRAVTSARCCRATTTPPTSSSRTATSAWCRTCAASTVPKATT